MKKNTYLCVKQFVIYLKVLAIWNMANHLFLTTMLIFVGDFFYVFLSFIQIKKISIIETVYKFNVLHNNKFILRRGIL